MHGFEHYGHGKLGHTDCGCGCPCGCGCSCGEDKEWHEPTLEERLKHLKGYKQALKEKLEYIEKLEKELESNKKE